ncbi:MAG: alpha-L-rhamnosidase C-terminal domain-containing protein [Armatimonadota bacterium]
MSLSLLGLALTLGVGQKGHEDILQLRSPIAQPYAYVHGGSHVGLPIAESPDPTINYRWNTIKNEDDLQIYVLRPKLVVSKTPQLFGNLASLTSSSPNVEVKGIGSIRLDFGVESGAWIEFDSPDLAGDVEMSISEYNQPGVDKTRKPERIGNTYRLKLNDEYYEGVRFGWIHVKSVQKPWHITGVRAVCQVKPTNYAGSFACSDPMLTKAWYVSAYGVKASLCKDYFGSILMERGDRISFTGDAHPSQAAALVAFANYDFVRKNLENTSKQDNGIRSYSLYWVLSLLDYYKYTGDEATLQHFLANADAKLESAYKAFGTNPPLSFYGWDDGLGAGFEIWFRPNTESQSAYKMLSIRLWSEFARTMEEIGNKELFEKYRRYAEEKYADVSKSPNWTKGFGIHASADAVNTDFLDSKMQQEFSDGVFSDRVNRLSISPFNQYFILQAMSRLSKWDDALTTVDDMWGGMIRYGGTATFEVYRPTWNSVLAKNDPVPNSQSGITSLCHPWGAGVVKWLNEDILGISPKYPGFDEYYVKPHLGTKLNWVSGTTPTPHGDIKFRYDVTTGKGQLISPKGTVARLGIPMAGRSVTQIRINGKLVWDGDAYEFDEFDGIKPGGQRDEFFMFTLTKPGQYDIQTTYFPGRIKTIPSKETYPARLVKQDFQTRGNWGGIYGRDGHILCGYIPGSKDKLELPSYVDSIDYFRAFPKAGRPDSTVWEASTSNPVALAPDRQNSPNRVASCVSNSDQTMTLAIKIKDRKKHRITLYFADWKNLGSSQAVEILDGETMQLLAPVSIVKNHVKGVYLVFEYDRSIKFRFNKIRGPLVTLSGVFFD